MKFFKRSLFVAMGLSMLTTTAMASNPEDTGVAVFAGAASHKLDDGTASIKPSGFDFGVRATLGDKVGLFGRGEYTHFDGDTNFQGLNITVKEDEFRAIVGYAVPVGANAKAYAEVGYEYIDQKANISSSSASRKASSNSDGFYGAVGGSVELTPLFGAYGHLAYLNIKPNDGSAKSSGPEPMVGVSYKVTKTAAVFGEFRYTALTSNGADDTYSSFRGGVKFGL